MLLSALDRHKHHYYYGEPDLCELAAVYAHGIAKNHPFVDGNKRTALVVSGVFLELNGLKLVASEALAAKVILGLAASEIDLAGLTLWFRDHVIPSSSTG